ncbi:hypothetical protein EV580_3144 [Mycobacterium sp. BK086]|nr:hypothetical protein EV580_3144 [Mycobacterium sp. BK086]
MATDQTELTCYVVVDTSDRMPDEICVHARSVLTGQEAGGFLTVEQALALRDLLDIAINQRSEILG